MDSRRRYLIANATAADPTKWNGNFVDDCYKKYDWTSIVSDGSWADAIFSVYLLKIPKGASECYISCPSYFCANPSAYIAVMTEDVRDSQHTIPLTTVRTPNYTISLDVSYQYVAVTCYNASTNFTFTFS